ncbi:MAG TPA: FMN-binding protein [Bacteroidales bacterium]|nr:FMN-binding protein [Bacteroidales bacterium]
MSKLILLLGLHFGLLNAFGQNEQLTIPKALLTEIKKLSQAKAPALSILKMPGSDDKNAPGRFLKVDNAAPVSYSYNGRVKCCRAGGCNAPHVARLTEEFEFFDYLILYDNNGKILKVKVYNYEATHGQEITLRKWLGQFIGFDASTTRMVVGKNVDSISGATISVHGITDDINYNTRLLRTFLTNNISKL